MEVKSGGLNLWLLVKSKLNWPEIPRNQRFIENMGSDGRIDTLKYTNLVGVRKAPHELEEVKSTGRLRRTQAGDELVVWE